MKDQLFYILYSCAINKTRGIISAFINGKLYVKENDRWVRKAL